MQNLADVRADLVSQLARLTDQMGRIESERRTPLDDDLDEQAIEREGQEALDAEQRATSEEIKAIQHALARLDVGRYGLCTSCGIPIDAARLEALPTAAHCIECERERAT